MMQVQKGIQFLTIFLLIFVLTKNAHAQSIEKVSPMVQRSMAKGKELQLFRIMVKGRQLPSALSRLPFTFEKVAAYDSTSFYNVETSFQELMQKMVTLAEVLYVEDATRKPREEALINNLDLSVNLISTIHNKFPSLNGNGLTFSLKENKPDTSDIDFAGRYKSTPLASKIVSQHATNMATMVAGAGNSWYLGKGAAWGADITSSDFANLLPDPVNVLQQFNISVQNHSYGVGVENYYGADAALYDGSLLNNTLIQVFSSGNSGTLSSATGSYAGLSGFANLTGSFKMAKNIITVGSTDSFQNVVAQSSKGPAHDGRVKPELVAFGIDGSSGSAALTSGVALILQQQFRQSFGQLPGNALVKAIILNSADDRGTKEVDYANGYGSLNALNAVRTLTMQRFAMGDINNNDVQFFAITIPAGIKKVKATLVWNDPPANPNAIKALVNDLDFEIMKSSGGEKWLPWVLNKFPHADSLKLPAARKRDSLNNIEQVTIENPVPGNYELIVRGYNVNASTQNFSIAYQFDSVDVFEWHHPLAADPVFPSAMNTLRWKSTYPNATASLEYSTNNGGSWQVVDPAVDLSKGYHHWLPPAVNGKGLLRMRSNNFIVVSDTFIMASRTETGIGFNCPDSFLFYWNKIPGADSFRIFSMGTKYLEPILTSSIDSFKVFQKTNYPSRYYAVAPLFNNREGVKSYTLDYSLQGVGCYVRSFLATLISDVAHLRISLGSLHGIVKVTLEKKAGNQFIPLEIRQNISSLQLSFSDNKLIQGTNSYRVRIDFSGGGIAYSNIESVFYFKDVAYVIYPNPALQSEAIKLAQLNVDDAVMQVFDATGVKVFEKILIGQTTTIRPHMLSQGVHFIRIIRDNKSVSTLKLIVL